MKLFTILIIGLIEIISGISIGIMIWGQFEWRFEQGVFGRMFLLVLTLIYGLIWLRVLQGLIKRIRDYVKDHDHTNS